MKSFTLFGASAAFLTIAVPVSAQSVQSDNNGSYNTGDRARSQTNVPVYQNKNGAVVGVSGTTTYQQPSQGGNGPQQGSQRGSTSDSSGTVYVRKTF
ncbi:hypothetical protein [Sphingomonas sp. TWP1-3-1]|uniref:hypothetical protein n=1 Tax=Sphingomonas sp. TWP1-3-1 TaxID=2804612 RepID=UPI003CF8C025